MSETLSELLEALGLDEEPYGIFYTDTEPTGGFVPKVGQPLSLEWEDNGMDREWGAPEALAMIRRQDFAASGRAFDAAFIRK